MRSLRIDLGACLVAALCSGCQVVFPLDGPGDGGDPAKGPYIVDGDYDGDGKPNATDPCPLNGTSRDDVDADSDGIPDDCDPDIADDGRDCIVLLDTFDIGVRALDPRWSYFPPEFPWQLRPCDAGPTALCSPRNAAPSAVYFDQTGLDAARVDVEVVMDGTAGQMAVFHSMMLDGTGVTGRGCGLAVSNASVVHAFAADVVQGAASNIVDGTMPVAQNDVAPFMLYWRATDCEVASPFIEHVPFDGGSEGGPLIGIYTTATEVDLHWIVAYGSHCP
ncbi:MAG TPA: hypothetical protein VFQ53_20910 [Kofleriaceae bacterium]|nr:hypothetical protein [Kofleriaceae bacterium]